MLYGSTNYGSSTYGGLNSARNPNADIDLTDLGAGGRLTLSLVLEIPNVMGAYVNLDDLGAGGRLTLYLNKDFINSGKWFSDAGELWKRVKQHAPANFLP